MYEPTTGKNVVKYNNQNQADKPASCIRRVNIEIAGISAAIKYAHKIDPTLNVKPPISPNGALSIYAANNITNTNARHTNTFINQDHQYSERDDVPRHSVKPRRQNAQYAANMFVYLTLLSLLEPHTHTPFLQLHDFLSQPHGQEPFLILFF